MRGRHAHRGGGAALHEVVRSFEMAEGARAVHEDEAEVAAVQMGYGVHCALEAGRVQRLGRVLGRQGGTA